MQAEQKNTVESIDGASLMRDIIKAILKVSEEKSAWPKFDYVNNVLTSELFPEGTSLWLSWGDVMIVRKGQNERGQMRKLAGFYYDPAMEDFILTPQSVKHSDLLEKQEVN